MSEISAEMVQDELVPNVLKGDKDSLVINPSQKMITYIVRELTRNEDVAEVQIVAQESVLNSIRKEFLTATKASELVTNNTLSVRKTKDSISGTLLITDNEMRCASELGEHLIITDGQNCRDDLNTAVESFWEESESFTFRTPPLQYIYDSMRDEINDEVADDYHMVIDGINEFEKGMDEIAAAILVAANHNILLYDISKWGEDCGLASKATFSRTKSRLEDNGYIQTDKVPIDVGRPRLRLKLAPNVLEEDYDGPVISAIQNTI